MLDERKLKILEALIQDYIFTAEPVGSRTLAKRYLSSISSATIRNEMADLEDLGYLEKPHTSAGRIPSDIAYRLYVDEIMKKTRLDKKEVEAIKGNIDISKLNVEDIIFKISRIISEMTNYTTVISGPKVTTSTIQSMHLIKISSRSLIIVMVSDTGIVKNLVVNTMANLTDDYIINLAQILNKLVSGVDSSKLKEKFKNAPEVIQDIPKKDIKVIIDNIISDLESMDSMDIYVGGNTNIFNFPEFSDLFMARELLDSFSEKNVIGGLLLDLFNKEKNVLIGKEIDYDQFKKCSIVTSTYSIDDKVVGVISMIGPTRMDYSKVVAWTDFVSKYLTDILNTLYK